MSERSRIHSPVPGLRKTLMGVLAAGALLFPGPLAAQGCGTMSAHFQFCPEGSPWAEARWIQFGDGSAIEMGAYYVEFVEHWAGRSTDGTLDAALDALLAEMTEYGIEEGMAPPVALIRDRFETETLAVVRALTSTDMDDDQPLLMATMIAEGAGARIAVMFGNDDETAADALAQQAESFVALIRPGQED